MRFNKLLKNIQEQHEEYSRKRRKAFARLVKEVLDKDSRFSIVPQPLNSLLDTPIESNNILGNIMLQREGTLAPVIIQPLRNKYGVVIDGGSRSSNVILTGYPSPHLAWSLVVMANELERQFTREVSWEASRHGYTMPIERKKYHAKTYNKRTSH